MLHSRISRWLLALLVLLGAIAIPFAAAASAFDDVPDTHPYAPAIETLRTMEIIHGFASPGGYPVFWPDQSITRAEFISMVVRTIAPQTTIDGCLSDERLLKLDGGGLPFVDVPQDSWYEPSLCVAWSKNIISGYADGTFRPDASIRFSEAAKILSVAFGLTDQNLPDLSVLGKEWYQQYIHFLAIAKAIPSSIVGPNDRITRGETAELLVRLIGEDAAPSVKVSLPEEEVFNPVQWITDERKDLHLTFSYPDSWTSPHFLSRGSYERNRLPRYTSDWTMYVGPKRICPGFNACIERDFSISAFRASEIPDTLDDLDTSLGISILKDKTQNGIRTILFDEDTPICTVRSALLITHDRMLRLGLHCGSTLNDPGNALLELLGRLKVEP
ncbi:MAG: S-layer homology domain-containing protein [Candidatus Peregrinibacteria bacterium]